MLKTATENSNTTQNFYTFPKKALPQGKVSLCLTQDFYLLKLELRFSGFSGRVLAGLP